MEKQYDDCKNRAQLDHHIEHTLKSIGHIQGDKFIQQNQMSRGGNGQPFRHALDNTK